MRDLELASKPARKPRTHGTSSEKPANSCGTNLTKAIAGASRAPEFGHPASGHRPLPPFYLTLGIVLLTLAALLGLGACGDPQTAAQRVGANGTLAATAQMDQYLRDARATEDARDATIVANAQVIAATAGVATLDAMQRDVTATAIATRAQATAAAVATLDRATAAARETELAYAPTQTEQARLEAAATVAARQTAEAATAIAAIHAAATNTQAAAVQATGTAVVVQTQTAIWLEAQADEAQRRRIENAALTVLIIIMACVAIYLTFILVRTINRNTEQAGVVQTYGLHKNPLLVAKNGRGITVINPLITTSAATTLDGQGQVISQELPEPMRQGIILGALTVLHQQAQHLPFPPVAGQPEKSERWKLGWLEHETATGGLLGSVPPALSAGPNAAPLTTPGLPAGAEVVEGEYRIVEPDHPEIRGWLEEVKRKLLERPEA